MQQGSNRHRIARRKVARFQLRVADLRRAMLHEASDMLTRRFDTIVVEVLTLRNMARNRRLSLAYMDSGRAEFRRQLACKEWLRRNTIVVAPRFFARQGPVRGAGR